MSDRTIERWNSRAWSDEQMERLFAEGFPPFIIADREAKKYIERIRAWFTHLDIVLVDGGDPVATGWGVPIRWNGTVDGLPTGYTDVTRHAVELHEAKGKPDTFVICGAVVNPDYKRTGVAAELMRALIALADHENWPRVIAPLRPTLKHRYPLTPIDEYVTWTRDDGSPFDAWIRLHTSIGGRMIGTAPLSQTMTGTVSEWEDWTEMKLPVTGDYVIPSGMSVLHIDRDADLGTYVEPNVWLQHR